MLHFLIINPKTRNVNVLCGLKDINRDSAYLLDWRSEKCAPIFETRRKQRT